MVSRWVRWLRRGEQDPLATSSGSDGPRPGPVKPPPPAAPASDHTDPGQRAPETGITAGSAAATLPGVIPHAAEHSHDPNAVAPVTRERVAASLRRKGYRYLVDEQGDLCGLWSYRLFSFAVARAGVLQIRGRWSRQADIQRLREFLLFCDTWNGSHSHPKCYVRVNDDGRVHLLTEVSLPVTLGLDDHQLDHHLGVGLAAGTAVFDELDRLFPDPVLQAGPG